MNTLVLRNGECTDNRTERPDIPAIDWDGIPDDLKALKRWVVWNWKWDGSQWVKAAYCGRRNGGSWGIGSARRDDPSRLNDFEDAKAHQAYAAGRIRFGVGVLHEDGTLQTDFAAEPDRATQDRPPKPVAIPVLYENIPYDLQRRKQWVVWGYVWQEKRKEWAKVPMQPQQASAKYTEMTGCPCYRAKSNDPATWNDFDTVKWFHESNPTLCDGIGIMLQEGLCGIDLDDCRDTDTGELLEWAQDLIQRADCYTEVSPSGSGVKMFMAADLTAVPGGVCGKRKPYHTGAVEVYDRSSARYFTVTGQRVGDISTIEERQSRFNDVYGTVFGEGGGSKAQDDPGRDSGHIGFGTIDLDDLIASKRDEPLRPVAGFDLHKQLEDMGVLSGEPENNGVWTKYPVKECPFNETHERAVVSQHQSGTVVFQCWHDSCSGRKDESRKTARDYFAHYNVVVPEKAKRQTGEDKPARRDTAKLAREYLADRNPHLVFIAGRPYAYAGTCYEHETDLPSEVRRWLIDDGAPHNNEYVSNVVNDLKAMRRDKRELPFWRDGADRDEMIPFCNGLLNLDRFIADGSFDFTPHTPDFVSDFALPFAFDSEAMCPQWLSFLGQVFEEDAERFTLAQEWFGYCLTADQRYQKLLLKVGVPRAGKGTLDTILEGLVGKRYYSGLDARKLITTFGTSKLVGKRVAVIPELHLEKEVHKYAILEKIKAIVGNDMIDTERKNENSTSERLPVKLTISANDLPQFYDSTGAFAARLLILPFNRSFEGREDEGLADRLLSELPGIAVWALEGLRRLRQRGHFAIPTISREIVRRVRRAGSPALGFLADCCEVDRRIDPGNLGETKIVSEDCTVSKEAVRAAMTVWGEDNDHTVNHDLMFRDLSSVLPRLKTVRSREAGQRVWRFAGIRLLPECAERARCRAMVRP